MHERLMFEPNVGGLKGSAYGKVLGKMVQGDISFYYHRGTSHEHNHALGEECAECDAHSELAHAAGVDTKREDGASAISPSEKRLILLGKLQLMEAGLHRNNSSYGLTAAHDFYLRQETEELLKFAYELDPSNYTNYANYYFYLQTTSSMGTQERSFDYLDAISDKTLEFISSESEDARPLLTAMNAYLNKMFEVARRKSPADYDYAVSLLHCYDALADDYHRSLDAMVSSGRVRYVSKEERAQMAERFRFMNVLRDSFEVSFERDLASQG